MFSLSITVFPAAWLSALGQALEAEGGYKESEMELVIDSSEHMESTHMAKLS